VKTNFHRLHNKIKHYDWGSKEIIPDFLGIKNSQMLPWAEMWMGDSPLAPSETDLNGRRVSLGELISADPCYYLGKDRTDGLPFLLKLLAVESPLSLQAHPDREHAREGFALEEKLGIAINDPARNFKDTNQKSEIICALSRFTLLCGFLSPPEIYDNIAGFLSCALPLLKDAFQPLLEELKKGDIRSFLFALLSLPAGAKEELGIYTRENKTGDFCGKGGLIRQLSFKYPKDPAILAPLFLNAITLESGEAVFIPEGVLHSFFSGFGIELSVSSDNVVRAGLTSKNTDIPRLMDILDFSPCSPDILSPENPALPFRYPVSRGEFSLSTICSGGGGISFFEEGPVICIVTEGELIIEEESIRKGESIFIPAGAQRPVLFEGNFRGFCAAVGIAKWRVRQTPGIKQ
jgi:mannose-6-phosphate isomerase